jgi:hypothetical protein
MKQTPLQLEKTKAALIETKILLAKAKKDSAYLEKHEAKLKELIANAEIVVNPSMEEHFKMTEEIFRFMKQ